MAKMITIDPEKLEKALDIHGLNKNDVSESLGYGRRYVTDAIRRGKLSSNAIAGISVLFSIDPKLYIKEEKPEEPEESTDEPNDDPINYAKLYECVYNAVYKAVVDAMEVV